MSNMELWDLYDAKRNLLGKTHLRGEPVPKGCFHLVVFVWVFSGDGRVLLTKRSPEKRAYPNLWEHTGGSVLAGETSLQAITRELWEETGIRVQPESFRLAESFCRKKKREFCDVYFLQKFVPESELVMQEGETCDAKWVTRSEFEEMIAKNEIAPPDVLRYGQLGSKLDDLF